MCPLCPPPPPIVASFSVLHVGCCPHEVVVKARMFCARRKPCDAKMDVRGGACQKLLVLNGTLLNQSPITVARLHLGVGSLWSALSSFFKGAVWIFFYFFWGGIKSNCEK